MININNAVQFQHLLWDHIMQEAHVVVDATCGNGHDLLYLAEHANDGCHLYGIDIQSDAIAKSQELLRHTLKDRRISITFIQGSHELAIEEQISEDSIDLLIFNLGYLPGGNHSIITTCEKTIQALENAIPKLSKQGIITLVVYPGTASGKNEQLCLEEFLSGLDQSKHNVCHWKPLNQRNNPPELYMIQVR